MALPYLREAVKTPGTNYAVLARITQPRVNFVKDCGELVDFIDELRDYDTELFTHKKMKTNPEVAKQSLQIAITALENTENIYEWKNDTLSQIITKAAEENGLAKGQLLWPIRTALSGKAFTPCGATEICELLGKKETLRRLAAGLDKL
jgi:glutamyl-tRNA synthetase